MSVDRDADPELRREAGGHEAGTGLRVLLVASAYPSLTTGRLRQVHMIRGLGARHRVRVVSLVGAAFAAAGLPALEGAAEVDVVTTSRRRARHVRVRRWLDRMREVANAELVELAEAVQRAAAREPVDVLLIAGREIGPVFGRLPRVPIVLDLCDSRSARLRGQLRVAPPAARPALGIRWLAERRYERSLLAASDHVLVASERDRAALDSRIPTPVTIVANGVDADTWNRTTDQLGADVAFSGAMDYPANADAAVHLATRVMPRVWVRRPETRLLIIGRDPAPDVIALGADPRVTVTGTVDDVRPWLEGAGVYAAPLRFASGIQNKLLEAMSMAIPVVTTPVAAAGLGADDGDPPPVRVAIAPEAFAEAIVAALDRRDEDPRPDVAGRRFVETRFGWGRSVATLEAALVSAVRSEGHGPGRDRRS